MFLRAIYHSGGRIWRLSSVGASVPNHWNSILTNFSALPSVVVKTHVRLVSTTSCDKNAPKLSTMKKDSETPRNAFVKIAVINKIATLSFNLKDRNAPPEVLRNLYTAENAPEYFMIVLRDSKNSLVRELNNKLSDAGITKPQFSQSIAKLYFTLQTEPDSNLIFDDHRKYVRDDIIKIINHLRLDDVAYESLKILLSLENDVVDPDLWSI